MSSPLIWNTAERLHELVQGARWQSKHGGVAVLEQLHINVHIRFEGEEAHKGLSSRCVPLHHFFDTFEQIAAPSLSHASPPVEAPSFVSMQAESGSESTGSASVSEPETEGGDAS